jgi:hypothetical protein
MSVLVANTQNILVQQQDKLEKVYKEANGDFGKMMDAILRISIILKRMSAVDATENTKKYEEEIKTQVKIIVESYNTWKGLAVTWLAAGFSLAGGGLGLSALNELDQKAQTALIGVSQAVGTAGTGISSFGSIFTNQSEAARTQASETKKRFEGKEDAGKSQKQSENEARRELLRTLAELMRSIHEANRAMFG